MTAVHGMCDDRFTNVRTAFEQKLASNEELGASIYLDIDGTRAIDLWGGHRDRARAVP